MTRAPFEAKFVAMAAPMPLEAPVTMANLASKDRICVRLARFVEAVLGTPGRDMVGEPVSDSISLRSQLPPCVE